MKWFPRREEEQEEEPGAPQDWPAAAEAAPEPRRTGGNTDLPPPEVVAAGSPHLRWGASSSSPTPRPAARTAPATGAAAAPAGPAATDGDRQRPGAETRPPKPAPAAVARPAGSAPRRTAPPPSADAGARPSGGPADEERVHVHQAPPMRAGSLRAYGLDRAAPELIVVRKMWGAHLEGCRTCTEVLRDTAIEACDPLPIAYLLRKAFQAWRQSPDGQREDTVAPIGASSTQVLRHMLTDDLAGMVQTLEAFGPVALGEVVDDALHMLKGSAALEAAGSRQSLGPADVA